MATVKKKKCLKTAPFDIYIYIGSTGEKFLLKNVHTEMKIRELKCYAELVVGIPYNLQRLHYLDEGDMLDDSDLRHNDVVAGATINLKLWRMWDKLVAAVCRGSIDEVLQEGVVVEKRWESLDPVSYRSKVAVTKEMASVALFIAAHRGRINLIKSLIDNGEADVNMKTPFGRTPLHAASAQGHSSAIDLMLEKGASMDEIDIQGKSALMVASQWGFKDSERHLFLFQWQTRAAKTKHKKPSKTIMMHQQFDSAYPTWLTGKYAQVYFCQTLPPGEFAGTGISAPRRRRLEQESLLQYNDSFLEQSGDLQELPPIDGSMDYDGTRYSFGGSARPVLPQIRDRLASSKSRGSSKSATFDEWLEVKKSKKQQQQQKQKEEKLRKQTEQENKRLAIMEGRKSFEDWKNQKSKQKHDLPNLEKKRDDIIREEPGRHYGLSFERWLNRTGGLDLY